jgi:hypothetical protein
LNLIGREPERSFFHFANMIGNGWRDKAVRPVLPLEND